MWCEKSQQAVRLVCCQDTFKSQLLLELQPNREHRDLGCYRVPTSRSSINWGAKRVAMVGYVLKGGQGAVPAACEAVV